MRLRTAACAFAALLATCGHPVAAQSLGGALTFSYAPEASNALQRVGVGLYQLPPGRFGFYTNGAGTFVDTEPFYDTLSETSFSPPDPVTDRLELGYVLNAGITRSFGRSFALYGGIGIAGVDRQTELDDPTGTLADDGIYYVDSDLEDEAGANVNFGAVVSVGNVAIDAGYNSFFDTGYFGVGFRF